MIAVRTVQRCGKFRQQCAAAACLSEAVLGGRPASQLLGQPTCCHCLCLVLRCILPSPLLCRTCEQVDVIELQKQYAELQEAHYQQVRRALQLASLNPYEMAPAERTPYSTLKLHHIGATPLHPCIACAPSHHSHSVAPQAELPVRTTHVICVCCVSVSNSCRASCSVTRRPQPLRCARQCLQHSFSLTAPSHVHCLYLFVYLCVSLLQSQLLCDQEASTAAIAALRKALSDQEAVISRLEELLAATLPHILQISCTPSATLLFS